MNGPTDDRLADWLARREEDPGTSGADRLEPGIRRAVEACSSLERELATLSLAVQGHPERAGPWVLLRPLGRGASGTVYLAEREDGAARAAVRFVSSLDGERLLETARRMTGWRHESVLPVLETGEGWIASEVSAGVPLASILASLRTDLTAEPGEETGALLRALAPVAEAVDAAHEDGIVHGGISPRRLDLARDGRLRLRDFGFDPVRCHRPPTPDVPPLGSPHHLAPEQAREEGETVPATDVYAFASVAWAVVTGAPPHEGRSLSELLARIRDEPLPAPPEGLEALAPCLAKDPADRPETLADLAAALRSVSG